jgi:formylglycine-generating enzyme required for sulfatase activity
VSPIAQWSATEIRALRHARRMSVREFANHLGLSDRAVSKWEAEEDPTRPRPHNQAALDTSLALADTDAQARFRQMVANQPSEPDGAPAEPVVIRHLVRHPIDGKLMTLIDAGPFPEQTGHRVTWLAAFYVDVHAITRAEYEQFRLATDTTTPTQRSSGNWPPSEPLQNRVTPIAGWADLAHLDHPHRQTVSRAGAAAGAPVTGVGHNDASAYARWATKTLLSPRQWDRAHRGDQAVAPSGVAEWCRTEAGYVRRGPAKTRTGFRCGVSLPEMLALLAI